MLPYYIGEYEPKENNIDFESAKKVLMKEDKKMVIQRRFERIINKMLDFKSYNKYEDIPENKEIFIYALKHVKTDKIDNYVLIGCDSDELLQNNRLFNFWSKKFINNELENRDFKKTGWPFMTLVKRNNFFKIQGISILN